MLAIGRRRRIIGNGARFGMLLALLAVCSVAGFSAIKAAEPNTWTNPASITTQAASQKDLTRGCDEVSVPAVIFGDDKEKYKKQKTHTYEGCVTYGKDVTLAIYRDTSGRQRWGIKSRSDTYYRVVAGASESENLRLMPGTNRLVYMSHTGGYVYGTITTIENALTDLVPGSNDGSSYIDHYSLYSGKSKKWLGYDDNGITRYMPAYSTAISPNGRYMIAWISYVGYVKMDFDTGRVTEIGRFPGAWYGGEVYNPVAAAITSDGRYAFIHDGPTVVDTENCGREVTSELLNSGRIFDGRAPECPKTQLYHRIADYVGYNGYGNRYRWNYDESALEFIVQPFPYAFNQNETKKVTVWLNREQESKLDYLALGDSFSSGEGDYLGHAGNRHQLYIDGTDEDGPPREKCHVSKRSYPFLLRAHYGLDSHTMQSVACSGAMIKDVAGHLSWLPQKLDGYDGQGDRLKGLAQKKQYQEAALDDFIPGRVRQIEFVKKYKPRTITITAGGNDVGFADIITACIANASEECREAETDGTARRRLAKSINGGFTSLRNLYIDIRNASPDTNIYVLGYPLIINDEEVLLGVGKPCALNAGFANLKERRLINEATRYMNDVIEAAAESAGVHYIDIEDALAGGRLCDSIFTEDVTGVGDQFWSTATDDQLRSFLYHPNVKGHRKIAEVVQRYIGDSITRNRKLSSDDNAQVPEYPEYFSGASETEGSTYVSGDNIVIVSPSQGDSLSIGFDEGTYGKTTIKVSMFSEPIDMGTAMPDEDGSLEYVLHIPRNIAVGYHTVVFQGTTFSGEPLEVAKTVFVRGSDPKDMDNDGIKDSEDQCLFISTSGVDYDNDSTDDACDIEVAERTGLVSLDDIKNEANDRRRYVLATTSTQAYNAIDTQQSPEYPQDLVKGLAANGLSEDLSTNNASTRWYWIFAFIAILTVAVIVAAIVRLKRKKQRASGC